MASAFSCLVPVALPKGSPACSARLTPVEVGHSDGRFSQILSGLVVGDKVLLHPPDTVVDGSAVSTLLR